MAPSANANEPGVGLDARGYTVAMGWIVGLVLELVIGAAILSMFVTVVLVTLSAFDPEFERRVAGLRRRLTPRSLSGSADSVR
jgi:hypothetical protein